MKQKIHIKPIKYPTCMDSNTAYWIYVNTVPFHFGAGNVEYEDIYKCSNCGQLTTHRTDRCISCWYKMKILELKPSDSDYVLDVPNMKRYSYKEIIKKHGVKQR